MDERRIAKLTDRQRECLRLAARPMTSKEIGLALNLSHRTVEGHLNAAVQTLQAGSRFAAARSLTQFETHHPYKLPEYSNSIVSAAEPVNKYASTMDGDRGSAQQVQEERAPFQIPPSGQSSVLKLLPIPAARGAHNDLKRSHRLFWILFLGAVWTAAFGAVPAGIYALTRLL